MLEPLHDELNTILDDRDIASLYDFINENPSFDFTVARGNHADLFQAYEFLSLCRNDNLQGLRNFINANPHFDVNVLIDPNDISNILDVGLVYDEKFSFAILKYLISIPTLNIHIFSDNQNIFVTLLSSYLRNYDSNFLALAVVEVLLNNPRFAINAPFILNDDEHVFLNDSGQPMDDNDSNSGNEASLDIADDESDSTSAILSDASLIDDDKWESGSESSPEPGSRSELNADSGKEYTFPLQLLFYIHHKLISFPVPPEPIPLPVETAAHLHSLAAIPEPIIDETPEVIAIQNESYAQTLQRFVKAILKHPHFNSQLLLQKDYWGFSPVGLALQMSEYEVIREFYVHYPDVLVTALQRAREEDAPIGNKYSIDFAEVQEIMQFDCAEHYLAALQNCFDTNADPDALYASLIECCINSSPYTTHHHAAELYRIACLATATDPTVNVNPIAEEIVANPLVRFFNIFKKVSPKDGVRFCQRAAGFERDTFDATVELTNEKLTQTLLSVPVEGEPPTRKYMRVD